MTEAEFLRRIDAHMDRGNELMQRVVEVHETNREFIREMTRRNEAVMRELVREVSAGREVLLDVHREAYAQREAIWTMIDELRTHGLGGRG
ncbi:MAG: hypothetical protein ACRDL3_11335 [Solirubrobacterales bacterium]